MYATYNLLSVERGDTFNKIRFTPDIDLTGAFISVEFKYYGSSIYKTLTNINGLTVTPSYFEIKEFIMDWPKGNYSYEIKVGIGSTSETHFKGQLIVTD